MEVWLFRLLVVAAVALFARQMLGALPPLRPRPGRLRHLATSARASRTFVSEIVFQSRTIRARPVVGLAHLFVFWGFCAFGGYTTVEGLRGLGVVDLTGTARVPRLQAGAACPSAWRCSPASCCSRSGAASCGPRALGASVSKESLLISVFIAVADGHVPGRRGRRARGPAVAGVPLERVNWWAHMLVILAFTVLIPDSKHLHLLLSPATVFLRAPILGTVPKLDFEKEQIGLETVGQLEKKQVLDAFTCVECGRCQENCPAFATGKVLNPKKLILQNEEALLAGQAGSAAGGPLRRRRAVAVHDLRRLPEPVPGRRRAPAADRRRAARPGLERRGAGVARPGLQQPRAPRQHLGPALRAAAEVHRGGRRRDASIRRSTSTSCGSAAPAPSRPTSRSRCGRCSTSCAAKGVRFGVLAKERCNGDVAKRTGNEYLFQELATRTSRS